MNKARDIYEMIDYRNYIIQDECIVYSEHAYETFTRNARYKINTDEKLNELPIILAKTTMEIMLWVMKEVCILKICPIYYTFNWKTFVFQITIQITGFKIICRYLLRGPAS